MNSLSAQGIAVAALCVAVGLGVFAMSVYQTIRLLRASRGGLAALAFGLFLVWIPVSVATMFFLAMFGSAHIAAMHSHEAAPGGAHALDWAKVLSLGYPALGLIVMWFLSRLGRAASASGRS